MPGMELLFFAACVLPLGSTQLPVLSLQGEIRGPRKVDRLFGEKVKVVRDRINLGKVIKFILIAVGLFIIGIAVFMFFRIRSNAKDALRDAKNVYLALYTTDIEYYAQGKSIYDHSKADGMAEGVKEKVEMLADSNGKYIITSYNMKRRQVTGVSQQAAPADKKISPVPMDFLERKYKIV